jgi:hypothetical protein
MNNNFIYLILVFYAITNIILARSENIYNKYNFIKIIYLIIKLNYNTMFLNYYKEQKAYKQYLVFT